MSWSLTKGFRVWARARRTGVVVMLTLAATVSLAATTVSVVARLRAELQNPAGSPLLFIGWMTARQYSDLRESSTAFRALGAYYGDAEQKRPLRDEMGTALVNASHLSTNVFDVLGTRALLGNEFGTRGESGGSAAIAISYGLWDSRYQRDRGVIGKRVTLDDVDGIVVAVLPQGFRFPFNADAWIEVESAEDLGDPSRVPVGVFGVLPAGVSAAEARAGAQELAAPMDGEAGGRAPRFEFRPFNEVFLPEVVQTIGRFGTWGAFGLLLLGCMNVAGLLLAHGAARRGTYRLHLALGADRGALAMIGIGEALPIACSGAALGLAACPLLNGLYNRAAAARMPFWTIGSVAWGPALGIAAFGLAVAVVAGSAAAGFVARGSGPRALSAKQRRGPRGLRVLASTVLAVQIGISLALVVLATSWALTVADARWGGHGFVSRGVYVARVLAPDKAYGSTQARTGLHSAVLQRMRLEFGADESVALASSVPGTAIGRASVAVEGQVYSRPEDVPRAAITVVSRDFFRVAGMEALRGNTFELGESSEPRAVVSRTFAQDYLGGTDAIGTRLRLGGPESRQPWLLIVGIVSDVYEGVGAMGLGGVPPTAHVYVPMTLFPGSSFDLLVKSDHQVSAIATGMQRVVEDIDARIALEGPRLWADALVEAMLLHTGAANLFGLFATVALILAAGGVFGATLYEANRRSPELAVRVALGAPPTAVAWRSLTRPLASTVCGLAAGAVGGYFATKSLASLIHGLQIPSAGIMVATSLVLLCTALCAAAPSLISVLRADPAQLIREQASADASRPYAT